MKLNFFGDIPHINSFNLGYKISNLEQLISIYVLNRKTFKLPMHGHNLKKKLSWRHTTKQNV